MNPFPIQELKNWFLKKRRALPWRVAPTPYRIWVSEVMLQQTRAAVVVSYFEKWMSAFPTIESLAKAPLSHVLKAWEGLGYYARARNLHAAARYLVEHFEGELPRDPEQLAQIKGIGPYTQGAIRSFAFRQKAAAVDGNVLRVLSRFYAVEESIDSSATRRLLTERCEQLLPDSEPWLISEGLIELGAIVCTKHHPKCKLCPLKTGCIGSSRSLQEQLPKRRPRPQTIELIRLVAVVCHEGNYLLKKGERNRVMADLYEFPYVELEEGRSLSIEKVFTNALNLPLCYQEPLEEEKHVFTRYRVRLLPHLLVAHRRSAHQLWKTPQEMVALPFSSGHRRIFKNLFSI